ncbi:MAG: DMT family transporter [Pseudomonadota bacterium]
MATDIVLALGAVLLWSTVATAFKLGLEVFDPLQLLTLAVTIATAFFLIIAFATGRLDGRAAGTAHGLGPIIDGPGARRAALLGLLNPLAYYLVLFAAYDRLPAQIAQPLNYTWSITLALLAVPLLRQPLGAARLLGIGISYCGVLIILAPWSASFAALSWLGIALALGSTLIWASYWLLDARTTSDPIVTMCIGFATACPLLIGACYLTSGWPELTPRGLAIAGWVGLCEMGIAFLLWQAALRRTKRAALLGQLIFLSPFLSLGLIHSVLGEGVKLTTVLGLVVIVAGLAWNAREPQPRTSL